MPFELKPCAFQKWARFDSWPIRQTAFVLLGHEPPSLADLFPASNNDYLGSRLTWGDLFDGIVDQEPFFDLKRIDPTEGSALLDMARMLDLAVQNNNIPWNRLIENRFSVIHVKPTDVLAWARNKQFAIPPELIALFPERLHSELIALPVRVSAQKTFLVTELIDSICSRNELDDALYNDEFPVYVRLPPRLAYMKSGDKSKKEINLIPGIYRIHSDAAKKLIYARDREMSCLLIECYPEPNPDRLTFQFESDSAAIPPIINYADLRIAETDIVAWCEAKGKRPEFLFGSSTSSLPKEKGLHNRSEDTYLKVINALLSLQYGTWTHIDCAAFARQLRRDFDEAGITFNMEEKNRPLITILKKIKEE